LIIQQYQSILHAFERRRKTVRAMDILFPELEKLLVVRKEKNAAMFW
jgi:hypothetical protein